MLILFDFDITLLLAVLALHVPVTFRKARLFTDRHLRRLHGLWYLWLPLLFSTSCLLQIHHYFLSRSMKRPSCWGIPEYTWIHHAEFWADNQTYRLAENNRWSSSLNWEGQSKLRASVVSGGSSTCLAFDLAFSGAPNWSKKFYSAVQFHQSASSTVGSGSIGAPGGWNSCRACQAVNIYDSNEDQNQDQPVYTKIQALGDTWGYCHCAMPNGKGPQQRAHLLALGASSQSTHGEAHWDHAIGSWCAKLQ